MRTFASSEGRLIALLLLLLEESVPVLLREMGLGRFIV